MSTSFFHLTSNRRGAGGTQSGEESEIALVVLFIFTVDLPTSLPDLSSCALISFIIIIISVLHVALLCVLN